MNPALKERILDLLEQWESAPEEERNAMIAKLQAEEPAVCEELQKQVKFDEVLAGVAPAGDVPPTCPPGPGDAVPAAAAVAAAQERPVIAGYDFLEELGKGGMGTVWKVRNLSLNNRIQAIKVITSLGDDRGLARFEQEAKAMALLKHEHIVEIYEYQPSKRENGRPCPYILMEYAERGSLKTMIGECPPLVVDGVRVMLMLAKAVKHAHQKRVFHRDLKPGNVVSAAWTDGEMSTDWEWGKPKLTDFGLAAIINDRERLTAPGDILGTPNYMAPEQAEGHSRAAAVDVYGLGGIFYWLLTGRDPFKGSDIYTVLQQVQKELPERPKLIRRQVPEELDTLCMNCLAKEASARPFLLEFIESLQSYLAKRPTPPGHPGGNQVTIVVKNEKLLPMALEELKRAGMSATIVLGEPSETRISSIVLTFDLPPEQATRLLQLVEDGAWADLGVTGAWYTNEEPDFDHPRVRIEAPGLLSKKAKPLPPDPLSVSEERARPHEAVPDHHELDQDALEAKWIAERDPHDNPESKPRPPEADRPSVDSPAPRPGESWQTMAFTPGLIRIPPGKALRFEAEKTVSDEQASALLNVVAGKQVPLYELDLSACKLVTEACLARSPVLPSTLSISLHDEAARERPPLYIPLPTEYLAKADFPVGEPLAEAKHARFMKFAWIPPGTFIMGDDEGLWGGPRHPVTITKGFYVGVVPVTQAQWLAVMGDNPSAFKGADRPVEEVSWHACQVFCNRLRERTGKPIRLPTEAEWEYACRAGTTTEYHTGDGDEALRRAGWTWLDRDHVRGTHTVGEKEANAWGLHDMHGNVWEWCQDWFDPNYYRNPDSRQDPQGPQTGSSRVLRGGSWCYGLAYCRAASRNHHGPAIRHDGVGVRVCFRLD